MNLLILNGPASPICGTSPKYRGVYRSVPSYCSDLSDRHELNLLFFWYLEEGGESGVVHDLEKAFRFAKLWNERLPIDQQYEVIEVTENNTLPKTNSIFLGVDISSGYGGYSLIHHGLKEIIWTNSMPHAIGELSNLISRHYTLCLNEYGLFKSYDLADECLRSMTALQSIYPNFYENGDLSNYKLFNINLVSGGGDVRCVGSQKDVCASVRSQNDVAHENEDSK